MYPLLVFHVLLFCLGVLNETKNITSQHTHTHTSNRFASCMLQSSPRLSFNSATRSKRRHAVLIRLTESWVSPWTHIIVTTHLCGTNRKDFLDIVFIGRVDLFLDLLSRVSCERERESGKRNSAYYKKNNKALIMKTDQKKKKKTKRALLWNHSITVKTIKLNTVILNITKPGMCI